MTLDAADDSAVRANSSRSRGPTADLASIVPAVAPDEPAFQIPLSKVRPAKEFRE